MAVGIGHHRAMMVQDPVLVGASAVAQTPQRPGDGVSCADLLCEAARKAVLDSGVARLGELVDLVLVTRGLSMLTDGAGRIAATIGATQATAVAYEVGIPQQTPINRAIRAVQTGEARAVVVAGAETKRRDDLARRAGVPSTAESPFAGHPDELIAPSGEIVASAEITAGAVVPVLQYAMIDSARRRALRWSLEAHRNDIASLWADFNTVAGTNPAAAFPDPMSATELRTPSSNNRLLAFPYNKWHSTQWAVDQAAAFVVTSSKVADDLGIDSERRVFPHVALESSHAVSLSRRAELHRWPAMEVLGAHASEHLQRPLSAVEHVELYSCFPAAVRVQQTELGLGPDRPATITGGMTFAGGPFNNFVFQATVAMVERLRSEPGTFGLVTAVSGLLTKPGLGVWSTEPPVNAPVVGDLADQAAQSTAVLDVDDDPDDEGVIATYSVVPVGDELGRVVAIVDLNDGVRAVGSITDSDFARTGMDVDLIGMRVRVRDKSLLV